MKRAALIAPLCLLSLLVGIRLSAQQGAKVEAPKKVEQGDTIQFQITIDQAANIEGYVGLKVASVDGSQTLQSNNYVLRTGRTGVVNVQIPVDAKTGKWKVVKVFFHVSNGAIEKELTTSGDLTFEVTPHETLVLPSQATVEIK
jgi:hypothetical protein